MLAAGAVFLQAAGVGRRTWFGVWQTPVGARGTAVGRTVMFQAKTIMNDTIKVYHLISRVIIEK